MKLCCYSYSETLFHRRCIAFGSKRVFGGGGQWMPSRRACLPPYSSVGAADGSLKLWDRRKPDSPLFAFHHHDAAVTVVEWSPQQSGIFASAGEDR